MVAVWLCGLVGGGVGWFRWWFSGISGLGGLEGEMLLLWTGLFLSLHEREVYF